MLRQRPPLRPALLDVIAQAEAAPRGVAAEDERYFLDQLRAALAGEAPADRLLRRYGAARADRLGRLVARYGE